MSTSKPDTLSTSEHLARSASVTGAATLTSRILGLARDQVLAALFGAGNDMDAFIVAFRIPNLVRDLFAEGAMSSAFVPTFTRYLTLHGKRDAWRLGNNVLNALLLVTGVLVVIGMLFAEPLVTMYAGDYASVPGKLALTVRMTRVMLPFLTTVAVAAAAMGMLNSLHHYFWPALAPAMFNVATIVCAFTLVPLMPAIGQPRIMAIAVAALAGGLGQVAIQWPSLRREGFRYRPIFDRGDAGLKQVLMLMGPGTLGLAATQVNIFVNTLLATSEGTGAVSWLTYAFRLMYLPIGLFGVSIGTAVLPAVSRQAATDDAAGIRDTLSRGLAMMLMVNVPATLGLIALATPIVRVLFERGHFLPADTSATAAAVRLYAVGLVGYSAARIASPTFYALGRSRVPVLVSVGTIALNVALSVTLVRAMGFLGLALSTSIAALANGGVLVWFLRQRLDGVEGRRLTVALVKVTCAAVVMALAALMVDRVMNTLVPGAALPAQVVRLAASIGGALTVLAVTAKLLRIAEFGEMLALLRVRVQKLLTE
ncbi:MAG: murein biosynthesis integral membrane protein MurJ [Acidobacteria bacterium 13_1_20CM_2_65_9]|nr:MAG: murein biosynthesis integral membrane protein MurJ [Acidobacteria bacterium 13_1_20CM_2_65_9]